MIAGRGLCRWAAGMAMLVGGGAFAQQSGAGLPEAPAGQKAAATTTSIVVNATQEEVAAAQVAQEETQRVLGVFPNFYVVYEWDAAPLTKRQKFSLAWRTTLDPVSVLVTGGFAGIEQAENAYSGYRQGAAGYGKRFGAALADDTISTFVSGAVLPVVFRQDPRYFYKGTGTKKARALYALESAVMCRSDKGRWEPNYSNVLGNLATGAISNLYYPAANRNGAGLTSRMGCWGRRVARWAT